jgi:hypothetical protein
VTGALSRILIVALVTDALSGTLIVALNVDHPTKPEKIKKNHTQTVT